MAPNRKRKVRKIQNGGGNNMKEAIPASNGGGGNQPPKMSDNKISEQFDAEQRLKRADARSKEYDMATKVAQRDQESNKMFGKTLGYLGDKSIALLNIGVGLLKDAGKGGLSVFKLVVTVIAKVFYILLAAASLILAFYFFIWLANNRGSWGGGGSSYSQSSWQPHSYTPNQPLSWNSFIQSLRQKASIITSKINRINRTPVTGRCDMSTQFQDPNIDPVNQEVVCTTMSIPRDDIWAIDRSIINDYSVLPAKLKRMYQDDHRWKVQIPYAPVTVNNTQYYAPQCSQMTYVNSGDPVTFFRDTDTACVIRSDLRPINSYP